MIMLFQIDGGNIVAGDTLQYVKNRNRCPSSEGGCSDRFTDILYWE